MSDQDKKIDEVEKTEIDKSTNNQENTEKVENEESINSIPEKDIHQEKSNGNKKGKTCLIIGIVVLLIVIGGMIYWWMSNRSLVNSYENKVYPEVYVGSEAVGELNEVDLSKKLSEIDAEIANKGVTVNVNGNEYVATYSELGVTTDKEQVEDSIMAYGKDSNFMTKLNLINKPEKKEYSLKTAVNEENIKEFVANIAEEVNVEPVNADASIVGGAVSIIAGQNGYELNEQAIIDSIASQIADNNDGSDIKVDGTLAETEPAITSAALGTIDTMVSSFTTYFSAGNSGHNIQTGASYFNNTLLMPGEEFSCTDGIGPTTAERGFVSSNTYVGGQVVPGMGGGVCQIATTLYNTELRAGILPTERQNHMMTVGYVGIGLDATLADDLIDLRFENTYDYPLIITTSSTGGSLTISIWSNSNATGGYTYEPRVEKVSSLDAYTYLDKYDASGNLVDSIYLNESVYQPFS